MALEVRMVGPDGALIRTLEDVAIPSLPAEVQLTPGTMILADYCFNSSGPWVKPTEILTAEDVAAVVFGKRGQYESMVIGNRRIRDEEEMQQAMASLKGCVLTRYPGNNGKEVFMFWLSPSIKKRLARGPDRRVRRVN